MLIGAHQSIAGGVPAAFGRAERHLNDSKRPFGCRADRHEDVGKGALGLTPFRYLVNDARFARVPGVLETPHPERYAESIRLLKSMVHL